MHVPLLGRLHASARTSVPVARSAFRIVAPVTGPEGHLLGHADFSMPANAQTEDPFRDRVAARLGKMFGDGAAIWLRMQAAYDAWHAEREVDVSAIPTLHAARDVKG